MSFGDRDLESPNRSIDLDLTPKELSFDEKLKKIQKYLPKGITENILSQRERIEGERKQVTPMFCDMEGFTPLVEGLKKPTASRRGFVCDEEESPLLFV